MQISSSQVKNLGVIFDSTLPFESQINSVIRKCYQLRNIGHIQNLRNDSTMFN